MGELTLAAASLSTASAVSLQNASRTGTCSVDEHGGSLAHALTADEAEELEADIKARSTCDATSATASVLCGSV
jgi:hypothetical protein